MTIDINELRKDKRPQSSTVVHALLDRLEAAEKERDFAKTEIARLHDDIRELTDVRVLDEEDRGRIVAWRQGTSAKPAPSVPDDIVREVLRDCCGTFHGSRHRITCEKYKGKRDQETSCEDE